nr:immunoglobulin light chain junction region [Macaca mulatta]
DYYCDSWYNGGTHGLF